jgi:hypothetical protein
VVIQNIEEDMSMKELHLHLCIENMDHMEKDCMDLDKSLVEGELQVLLRKYFM